MKHRFVTWDLKDWSRFSSLWKIIWSNECINCYCINILHLLELKINVSSELVEVQKSHTTKIPYGETSVRRPHFTAKFSYGEISVRWNFLGRNFFTAKFPSALQYIPADTIISSLIFRTISNARLRSLIAVSFASSNFELVYIQSQQLKKCLYEIKSNR